MSHLNVILAEDSQELLAEDGQELLIELSTMNTLDCSSSLGLTMEDIYRAILTNNANNNALNIIKV